MNETDQALGGLGALLGGGGFLLLLGVLVILSILWIVIPFMIYKIRNTVIDHHNLTIKVLNELRGLRQDLAGFRTLWLSRGEQHPPPVIESMPIVPEELLPPEEG